MASLVPNPDQHTSSLRTAAPSPVGANALPDCIDLRGANVVTDSANGNHHPASEAVLSVKRKTGPLSTSAQVNNIVSVLERMLNLSPQESELLSASSTGADTQTLSSDLTPLQIESLYSRAIAKLEERGTLSSLTCSGEIQSETIQTMQRKLVEALNEFCSDEQKKICFKFDSLLRTHDVFNAQTLEKMLPPIKQGPVVRIREGKLEARLNDLERVKVVLEELPSLSRDQRHGLVQALMREHYLGERPECFCRDAVVNILQEVERGTLELQTQRELKSLISLLLQTTEELGNSEVEVLMRLADQFGGKTPVSTNGSIQAHDRRALPVDLARGPTINYFTLPVEADQLAQRFIEERTGQTEPPSARDRFGMMTINSPPLEMCLAIETAFIKLGFESATIHVEHDAGFEPTWTVFV